jgi:hypothetical protein
MYSFVNDFPEDGLQGPKHVGGASQNNNIYGYIHISWIKCCIAHVQF